MGRRRRAGATWAVAAAVGGSVVMVASGAPTEVRAAGHTVTIQSGPCIPTASGTNYCYTPPSLTINAGDSVTWSNGTGFTHTATRCPPPAQQTDACSGAGPGTGPDTPPFDTRDISAGSQSAPVTFHGAGTYQYYCTIHGYAEMHAIITVQGSGTPTATAPPPTHTPTPRPTLQSTSSSTSSRSSASPTTTASASSSSTTASSSTSASGPVAEATPTATPTSGADTGATGAVTTPSGSSGGGHGGLIAALAIIGALFAAGAGIVVLRGRSTPPT